MGFVGCVACMAADMKKIPTGSIWLHLMTQLT